MSHFNGHFLVIYNALHQFQALNNFTCYLKLELSNVIVHIKKNKVEKLRLLVNAMVQFLILLIFNGFHTIKVLHYYKKLVQMIYQTTHTDSTDKSN